ncbi:MAG: nucleotidyltransferase domain-containing protein [Candidatus Methanoplasma sp.]|jgi:predicted nucleotidyltransferase|nr:nucleotidyltransferase domain-containing protein [Candidatus Methanoplasma sp.]
MTTVIGYPDNTKVMSSNPGVRNFTFEEMREIVTPIAIKYDVRRVYLFGSRARGDYKADSDYDFCVLPGERCGIINLSGFLIGLKEAFGEVDLVSEGTIDEEFRKEIQGHGRLVFEV